MLNRIIEASVENRFLVVIATLMVIGWGVYAMLNTPLDAIPDLSDVQVIVYSEYPGQAPQVVEDQVTYPLTTAMLSVPYAKTVRGYSFFGISYVYVIFEDGTDMYWARSRVLEYLNSASDRLPQGVTPSWDQMRQVWVGFINIRCWIRLEDMIFRNCARFRIGICGMS